MQLNWSQTWALKEIINLFGKIGKDQKTLVGEIGSGVLNADLSRAKKGYVPPKKWERILERLEAIAEAIAQNGSNPSSERVARQICVLIRTRLHNVVTNVVTDEKVDESAFGDYPELKIATLARRCNQLLNSDIWNVAPPTSILTAEIDYPQVPNKPKEHDFIKRLIGENWEQEHKEIKQLAEGMKPFQRKMQRAIFMENTSPGCQIVPMPQDEIRRLLSPARIKTTALIYLIPFYYTTDRWFDYGVIRYGSHKSLGVLVSRATLSRIFGSEPDVINREEFLQFLKQSANLKIHHVDPYSAEHIICQMLLEFHSEELLGRFNDANRPPEINFSEAAKSLASHPDTTLLVFDLADKFALAGELLAYRDTFADHKIVRLDHGVKLDVGIGFSLRAFDWIVSGNRFKSLHQSALKMLQEIKNSLKHAGIEIDDPAGEK